MMRLQRYLAEGGTLSRRQADELIAQGRVTVNGKVAEPGTVVDPEKDRVKVDLETVRPSRHHLVLAMHKPRGVVCSEKDPEGRRNVQSLLPDLPVRVHSIGRLDLMSEGLLLFTNDGDLTRQLTQSGSGIERVYEVKIQGGVPAWALERLERGVNLDDGRARAASCKRLRMARTNEWLEVTMTEGRYREVRRMFQTLGMNVLKLKRTRFGSVRLGKMPSGATRLLSADEITALTENRPPRPERPAKTERQPKAPRTGAKPARPERAGTLQHGAQPARPARPERPERPERSQRPMRPGAYRSETKRPARPARPDRGDRPPASAMPPRAPRPRHDDDEIEDYSGAAARRFEAEVADAVRKAAAMKGARPATRLEHSGPIEAPDRGHAEHAGRPGEAPARGPGRGPGRTAGPRSPGRPERPVGADRTNRPAGRPERPSASRPATRPERPSTSRPATRPERPSTNRPAGRPERLGRSDRPGRIEHPDRPDRSGRPARPTRHPAKPAGRPRKPAGKPQRSVHANKPQKV